jgi:predicted enzyme related to lactoylglutathione lyase
MSNEVKHFAINADDLPRARRFYERVFAWRFEPWGPPGFFMIATGAKEPRLLGSLQQRRELVPGRRMNGFECTIGVEQDVEQLARAVEAHGGRILMEKATIPGVGDLIWFEDPEGNVAGAMRYDAKAE